MFEEKTSPIFVLCIGLMRQNPKTSITGLIWGDGLVLVREGAPSPSASKAGAVGAFLIWSGQFGPTNSFKSHQDGCSPSPCCGPEMLPSSHHSLRGVPFPPAQGWRWRWPDPVTPGFTPGSGVKCCPPHTLPKLFFSKDPPCSFWVSATFHTSWDRKSQESGMGPLEDSNPCSKAGLTLKQVVLLSVHPAVVPACPRMKP